MRCRVLPGPRRSSIHTGVPAGIETGIGYPAAIIQHLCRITRPVGRSQQRLHRRHARDRRPLGSQVHTGRGHTRHRLQRPFHPTHAGSAAHVVHLQHHRALRHLVAQLLHGLHQLFGRHGFGQRDSGLFGGKVDRHLGHPRHLRQPHLHTTHTGCAAHALDRQYQGLACGLPGAGCLGLRCTGPRRTRTSTSCHGRGSRRRSCRSILFTPIFCIHDHAFHPASLPVPQAHHDRYKSIHHKITCRHTNPVSIRTWSLKRIVRRKTKPTSRTTTCNYCIITNARTSCEARFGETVAQTPSTSQKDQLARGATTITRHLCRIARLACAVRRVSTRIRNQCEDESIHDTRWPSVHIKPPERLLKAVLRAIPWGIDSHHPEQYIPDRCDTAGHGTARHACQHTPSGKHDSPDRPCSLHTFSPTLHIFAPHTASPPISHFPARAQSHRHTQYTTPPASFAQYRRNFVTRSPADSHPRRVRRSPQKSQTRTCSASRYNPLLFFQGAFQRQQTSAPGGSTT